MLLGYKKIVDYHKDIGINSLQYFCLDKEKRREKNLPYSFFEQVYQRMHLWLKLRPTITPPHHRDLLEPTNDNHMHKEPSLEVKTEDGSYEMDESKPQFVNHDWSNSTINLSNSQSKGLEWGQGPWNKDLHSGSSSLIHPQALMDLNVAPTQVSFLP